MRLNHLHLSVEDVDACADALVRHFGFTLVERRGRNGFAVLHGEGCVLALMRLRRGATVATAYPDAFHVGFLVDGADAVTAKHAELHAAALPDLQPPTIQRGALRFYVRLPGGLVCEIGHEPGGPPR